MIAVSAVLVLIALVTFVLGFFQTGFTMIAISIASSVAAFVFLVLGVLQDRKREPTLAGMPFNAGAVREEPQMREVDDTGATTTAVLEPTTADDDAVSSPLIEEVETIQAPSPPRRRPATSKPATAKSTSKTTAKSTAKKAAAKPAAKKTTAKKATASSSGKQDVLKAAAKKAAAPKPKTAAKKTAAKPAAKKPAARKPAPRKPAAGPDGE